jgi:hypothetical protein
MRGGRKLHDEEFYNMYCSPNIGRMIKSRKIKWVRDVVLVGEKRNSYKIVKI